MARPQAGRWEKQAAADLAHYWKKMGGGSDVRFVLGSGTVPVKPFVLQRDSIHVWRDGNTIHFAGSNDDSQYFAVAYFLRLLGCRWYLPGPVGECIPARAELPAALNVSYTPPFEVRSYWISWLGDRTDYETFAHRNFYNLKRIPAGHNLGNLWKKGSSPLTAADEVVAKIAEEYGRGESISLSIDDAIQRPDPEEIKASLGIWDKYFQVPSLSDMFLEFYNRVANELARRHPASKAKLGFLAYVNLTLPPQKAIRAAESLIAYLAPIDIDPNHAFGTNASPERDDYRGALERWVQVMQGRVILYDYDQGMLVWRDLPNPSHHVFSKEVGEYARLEMLGIDTESRNALGTTFLNLYFRGQLMWNPKLDIQKELTEFFPIFYGQAAAPMERYWRTIYKQWENTTVTEHEHFVVPAIYPRSVVRELGTYIAAAPESERVRLARLGYEILDAYTEMVEAAATRCDYAAAVKAGERGLKARDALTDLNPTFTTYRAIGEKGPAWWPGEVKTYRKWATLKARPTPLRWDFRADPDDHGIWRNWAADRGKWDDKVTTDLYLQAQGIRFQGYGWYRCQLEGGGILKFPGLFNESWLYLDGNLVAHREQNPHWWKNDYEFSWEAPLPPGKHWVVLRTRIPHHFAGLFRRPFVYRN